MRRLSWTFATGIVGLFLLMLGLGFLWFGTRSLIKMWAWEKLTLKNGSEAMMRWVKPPFPIYLKIYVFNVTNPKDVSEGALPKFSEVGPYVYEEMREKVNVTQAENYTLFYKVKNTIKFKRRLSSPLRQSDKVTVLNVPLAGGILSVYETVPEFVGLWDELWKFFSPGQENIFTTITVKELLFDGITIDCSAKATEIYIACRALETRNTYSVRKEGKNFKFSFLHAKNGTSPETYQVNQGIFDLKTSAQLISMDNSTSIKKWKDPYCDMINGSDGAQFPVKLNKKDKLYIFEKDLCRSVYVEFEKEVKMDGVILYKYSISPNLFASPDNNPENSCFCRTPLNLRDLVQDPDIEPDEDEENGPKICFENGVLALMPCVGAPIVASFPHFYLGDQSYINYSGLNPVKKRHETYVYIEPNSGIAVAGFKRIQFNLELKKIADVEITSKLTDGLFPILWIEEGMELSSELFKLLRYTLIEKEVLEYGTFVLVGLGFLLIILPCLIQHFCTKSMCRRKKLTKTTNLTSSENDLVYVEKFRSRLDGWQKSKHDSTQGSLNQRLEVEVDNGRFLRHSLVDNFM